MDQVSTNVLKVIINHKSVKVFLRELHDYDGYLIKLHCYKCSQRSALKLWQISGNMVFYCTGMLASLVDGCPILNACKIINVFIVYSNNKETTFTTWCSPQQTKLKVFQNICYHKVIVCFNKKKTKFFSLPRMTPILHMGFPVIQGRSGGTGQTPKVYYARENNAKKLILSYPIFIYF